MSIIEKKGAVINGCRLRSRRTIRKKGNYFTVLYQLKEKKYIHFELSILFNQCLYLLVSATFQRGSMRFDF